MFRSILAILMAVSMLGTSFLSALQGRADIGAAAISIDLLKSGKTVQTRHFYGAKGDATIAFWRGIALKPSFILAEGDGSLSAGALGIGQCVPLWECWTFIPNVGVALSYLRTKIDIPEAMMSDVKAKYRSVSPYVALDVTYKITEKWSVLGYAQYAWCRTKTSIGPHIHSTERSEGPNYALALEYSVTPNWSATLGVGYNESLSREKHGLRGKGVKLGTAYYF